MEKIDNLPSNFSSKDGRLGVLIFATVFSKFGIDQLLPLLADSAPLSALSPSPLCPARP